MYLRKTLRNKEPDTCSAKADGENDENVTNPVRPVHISPQRRAFNGDAYFHNEVSLHKTSKSSPQPFNRQEASPESLLNGEKAAPNTATAAIASSIGSFVNFEALAHNVIRDELLASRGQAKPQDSNTTVSPRPEDLSKNTETSYTVTKPITNPLTTPTIENHHPTGPKSTPSLFSIRSRTHCPRSSRAPPPFIPTKSKTHQYQPEIAADAAETNRSQLATRTEELSDRDRIPEWNSNQQKRQFVELSMLGSHSPSSPKRPC
uniref:Uncharacterized protein n=1 Tax=Ciona savignyi TaxID=51511 RepID=H2YTM9_CIOSA